MDFMENHLAWNGDLERGDSYMQGFDGAISQTIARAIRDATQMADPALQQEAASWLWTCCPDIAEQVELPELHYERLPSLATAYMMGDSVI